MILSIQWDIMRVHAECIFVHRSLYTNLFAVLIVVQVPLPTKTVLIDVAKSPEVQEQPVAPVKVRTYSAHTTQYTVNTMTLHTVDCYLIRIKFAHIPLFVAVSRSVHWYMLDANCCTP